MFLSHRLIVRLCFPMQPLIALESSSRTCPPPLAPMALWLHRHLMKLVICTLICTRAHICSFLTSFFLLHCPTPYAALNCFGEQFQDLPTALCRGDPLHSQLGLWPVFSMLNHSCIPNAVNYTLGPAGYMVVRACRPIMAGEEVCINYLGRGSLRPAVERQRELEESYGFLCGCPR